MSEGLTSAAAATPAGDASRPDWLSVRPGSAPLLVSLPHTGTDLPSELEGRVVSPWLARKDADWWIDRPRGFATDLGATTVHTALSRTAIDIGLGSTSGRSTAVSIWATDDRSGLQGRWPSS